MGIAEATQVSEQGEPPFGMAPVGRFLQIYNRQLSHARPAMEEWFVFGGFLDELPSAAERDYAEAALCRLAAASADCFERVCGEVEALAAPAWQRRMRVQMAASLDELQYDQTGARLAALAAVAAQLGWETGEDIRATGFGTRRTSWRFAPRGGSAETIIQIRVGGPRLLHSAGDPIELDFILAPDDMPSAAIRAMLRRLAELTAAAAAEETVVDLPLRRRLELIKQL
jgi:hypothetical protein